MKKDIIGFNKEKIADITLSKELSQQEVKTGSIYYKLMNENANIHTGTAFKKNRSLVRGGGRKPYRQKGTGRARQGTIRAPHYRTGGNTFGNQRKNYKFKLPAKLKQKAILSIFNLKFKQDAITIIDDIKISSPRVKEIINLLKNLIDVKKEKFNLVVLKADKNLIKAVKNLANIKLISLSGIKVVDLLNSNKIFITQSAVKQLNEVRI